jgi:D-lyxose ketol-isomerase
VKRSDIDAAVGAALELAAACSFALPGFAHLSRSEWVERRGDLIATMQRGLGWDVTDFGRGHFARYGLTLCTLRNGSIEERDAGRGQTYAEKLLAVRRGQETPFHLHERKTEDIIHRGGPGVLVLEAYPAAGNALGAGSVRTLIDGVWAELRAGERLKLEPGQSLQVPAGVYHRFWAEDGPVLAGEVSSVNDDVADNRFLETSERYPGIEEDSPARYLLVGEYEPLLRG